MKTFQITSLLAAVALSAACHHKRPATNPRVASIDAETREGAKQMEADIERDAKESGDRVDDDLDAALEGRHDAVASEADDASDTATAAADEASADAKLEYDADAAAAIAAADEIAKSVEPKKVSAEIETIDRHAQQITFRIRDEDKEISLQAGREMKVEFSELPGLTGMKTDVAISKMHEGQDVDLKVTGKGEDAKVVKLDLGDF